MIKMELSQVLSAIFVSARFVTFSATGFVAVIVGLGNGVSVGVGVGVEVAKEAWAVMVATAAVDTADRTTVPALWVAQALSISAITIMAEINLKVFIDHTSILLKRFIVTLSLTNTILALDAVGKPRKGCEQAVKITDKIS